MSSDFCNRSNTDTWFNSTNLHTIGARCYAGTAISFFDGLISDTIVVDGSKLPASNFSETDTNGYWVPKKFTGTYGTNGGHYTGADSGALGRDYSRTSNYCSYSEALDNAWWVKVTHSITADQDGTADKITLGGSFGEVKTSTVSVDSSQNYVFSFKSGQTH